MVGGGGSFNILDGTRRSPSSKGRNLWPPEAGGVDEVKREALIKFWFRFFKSEALMERKDGSMKRTPATRCLIKIVVFKDQRVFPPFVINKVPPGARSRDLLLAASLDRVFSVSHLFKSTVKKNTESEKGGFERGKKPALEHIPYIASVRNRRSLLSITT